MSNEKEYFDYAMNPYAIGEKVAGKSIKWDTLDNPGKTLSEILNVKEEELFSDNSLFITPNIQIQKNGSIKHLNPKETRMRVQKYVAQNTKERIVSKPPIKGLRLSSVGKRIPEIMFVGNETQEDFQANVPWTPDNVIWADVGDYFEDVAEITDPKQGALADCYLIAALTSVAWSRPYVIVNATRPSSSDNEENPIHKITFYRNGKPEEVEVSERIPLDEETDAILFASSKDPGEIWPAVIEKAYAKWKTGSNTDYPNYEKIAGGSAADACAELIGGKASYKLHSSISENELIKFIKSNCVSYRAVNPMVASSHTIIPKDCDYKKASLAPWHAYSILGYEKYKDEYYVILRNPWGCHHGTLDTRDGDWNVYNNSFFAKIALNQNGIFSMKLSTFKKYFRRTGVAK